MKREKFEKMKRFKGKLASTMTDACQGRVNVAPQRRGKEKYSYLCEIKNFIDQRNTLQTLEKQKEHSTTASEHSTNNTKGKT